jgi:predicted adenylyl cyclase CyaB
MRNIELKARLTDFPAARRIALRIATDRLGVQHQVDTYFQCNHGRLKLRQIDGLRSELVWYERPDRPGARESDYEVVPVANPETLKTALSAALGVRVVVEKEREIYLRDNVRIHFDDVVGLGMFIEFEAVLAPDSDDAAGHAQLQRLQEEFGIREADLVPESYSDMLR